MSAELPDGAGPAAAVLDVLSKFVQNRQRKWNKRLSRIEELQAKQSINEEQGEAVRKLPGVLAVIAEWESVQVPLLSAVNEIVKKPPSPPSPADEGGVVVRRADVELLAKTLADVAADALLWKGRDGLPLKDLLARVAAEASGGDDLSATVEGLLRVTTERAPTAAPTARKTASAATSPCSHDSGHGLKPFTPSLQNSVDGQNGGGDEKPGSAEAGSAAAAAVVQGKSADAAAGNPAASKDASALFDNVVSADGPAPSPQALPASCLPLGAAFGVPFYPMHGPPFYNGSPVPPCPNMAFPPDWTPHGPAIFPPSPAYLPPSSGGALLQAPGSNVLAFGGMPGAHATYPLPGVAAIPPGLNPPLLASPLGTAALPASPHHSGSPYEGAGGPPYALTAEDATSGAFADAPAGVLVQTVAGGSAGGKAPAGSGSGVSDQIQPVNGRGSAPARPPRAVDPGTKVVGPRGTGTPQESHPTSTPAEGVRISIAPVRASNGGAPVQLPPGFGMPEAVEAAVAAPAAAAARPVGAGRTASSDVLAAALAQSAAALAQFSSVPQPSLPGTRSAERSARLGSPALTRGLPGALPRAQAPRPELESDAPTTAPRDYEGMVPGVQPGLDGRSPAESGQLDSAVVADGKARKGGRRGGRRRS